MLQPLPNLASFARLITAGRRKLHGALDEPDIHCPIIRGDRPRLDITMAATRDLPKIGSACTTVVVARD